MQPKINSVLLGVCFLLTTHLISQDCVRTGLNGTIVNSTCIQVCRDLNFQIPDIRSTSSYTFISTPYNPFPYVTAGGTIDPTLYDDDNYSNVFPLPFPFCFYDNVYTQVVVSSNGLITLDPAYGVCAPGLAGYIVNNPIPFNGSGPDCSAGHYPRASIMGNFTDLDARAFACPPDRRIEWRSEGVAPCRRFVASFYHMGKFGSPCGIPNPYTFQLILYESTGMIDIMVENSFCSGAPGNRAILGIQDITRTQGIAAPGKNAQNWVANNEGFRFVPSGGISRFVSSELLTMSLAPVATAVSTTTTPGLLDISFPNVCTPNASTQYIIRTTYSSCDNPAISIVGYDTIAVNRDPMQETHSSTQASCPTASDGTITIIPVGNAPYSYVIDGGAPIVAGSPYTFTGLTPGLHTIVATDAIGCTTIPVDVIVPAGSSLTTTGTTSAALCNGTATGSITVDVPTTGTPPYQYSLDNVNWQSSNIFNGLPANTYTVYFQDAAGCSGSFPLSVGEPAALNATAVSTPVVCNGESNGIINVTANGGVAPYQYSINGGGTWQSSNVFNVAANNYTVTIRDANNCTTTQNVTVTEPAVLTASTITTNASCNGGSDGTITVNAAGGNSGYQYSLDGVNFQSSNVFNVLANNYTVTIKDNLGCITTANAVVGLTNDLNFTPQADETICEGTSVQLNLVSNGLQFSWSPATGLSDATISNPVASPTTTTNYTVTITRGLCTATDNVTVNVNPAPIPNAGPDGFICFGQTYQLQGSGGAQYRWTPSTYLNDVTISNPVSTPARTITYTLSEVVDAIGCKSLTTDQVVVDVTPPIKVTTTPFDTVVYAGDQFQINASSIANQYNWTPAIGLSNTNIPNPVVTAGAIGTEIQYKVKASTSAGCIGEGFVKVRVYTGPDIYVPTAFSPNNDGKNDRFTPFPVGITGLNYFRVFNRWGQLLFSTNKLHEGWDGKMGGVEQPSGVYVWMAEGVTEDKRTITKKGTVMLIR